MNLDSDCEGEWQKKKEHGRIHADGWAGAEKVKKTTLWWTDQPTDGKKWVGRVSATKKEGKMEEKEKQGQKIKNK